MPDPEQEAIGRIPLRKVDGSLRAFAIVDADDYEWLKQWRWWISGNNRYVGRYLRPRKILYLHRVILGVTDPKLHVDHRDGDPLNNRRSNLRVATAGQNQQNRKLDRNNTSGYRGVHWHARNRKWVASCRLKGHRHTIGAFETAEAAGAAAAAFRAQHMPYSPEAAQ